MASYATIAVAVLTIMGGLFAYSFQKRADRKSQLIEIRRTAYRAYLAALMDQIDAPTAGTLNKLHKSEFDLFAVASDNTIRKVGEFSNYMSATSYGNQHLRDRASHKRQLAEVLLAMRKDCFEKSRLSIEEAVQLLPMQ
jgi:hypothetical protein